MLWWASCMVIKTGRKVSMNLVFELTYEWLHRLVEVKLWLQLLIQFPHEAHQRRLWAFLILSLHLCTWQILSYQCPKHQIACHACQLDLPVWVWWLHLLRDQNFLSIESLDEEKAWYVRTSFVLHRMPRRLTDFTTERVCQTKPISTRRCLCPVHTWPSKLYSPALWNCQSQRGLMHSITLFQAHEMWNKRLNTSLTCYFGMQDCTIAGASSHPAKRLFDWLPDFMTVPLHAYSPMPSTLIATSKQTHKHQKHAGNNTRQPIHGTKKINLMSTL